MSDADVVREGLLELVEAFRTTSAVDPVASVKVSSHQARILRQLDNEDPTMVGELADHFGVTPSTMSLNLSRLEEAGCVRRSRDPEDRRVMNVRLTPAGLRIKEATSVLDIARVDAVLASLRPEERARAVEGIGLLLEGAHRVSSRAAEYLDALTGDATS
ncbi:MAG: MarR family transcriptional regulator [Gemmatimonadetes bacterium]|nr:MarR family transcriptional regulator [Gemmatimonadota bacterium]